MNSLNIKGIQHIGIPVTDIDRSCDFYQNLGFSVAYATTFQNRNFDLRMAMLVNENLTIEVYEFPPSRKKEIIDRSDGFIDHVALNVTNIEETYKEIKSRGLEILEENPPVFLPFWEHGVKFFTIRGPDGEKIEFNQIL
jgi:catechol 2,3-dioxygenase-like lactoylglutathione lyase family enzyme